MGGVGVNADGVGAGIGLELGDLDIVGGKIADVAEIGAGGWEDFAEHVVLGIGGFFFGELDFGVVGGPSTGDFKRDVVEGEIFNGVAGDAVDEETDELDVFGGDVFDGNVAEVSRCGHGLVTFAESFEAGTEADRNGDSDTVHGDVGNGHMREVAPVDGVEGDASHFGVGDGAVGDGDVGETADGFSAELDGVGAGGEFAVGGGDLGGRFSGCSGFDDEGVVAGDDVTMGDGDVFAGVDVDAVVVAEFFVAGTDGDVVDEGIFGLGEVEGPGAGVFEVDVFDGDVGTANPADEERADGIGFLFRGDFSALAVDGAGAFDGDVVGVEGNEKGVAEGIAGTVSERIEVAVIGGIGGAEEDSAFVEVEGDVGLDLESAGEVFAGGEAKCAAAMRGKIINRGLQRAGVQCRPIANCAMLCHIQHGIHRLAFDGIGMRTCSEKRCENENEWINRFHISHYNTRHSQQKAYPFSPNRKAGYNWHSFHSLENPVCRHASTTPSHTRCRISSRWPKGPPTRPTRLPAPSSKCTPAARPSTTTPTSEISAPSSSPTSSADISNSAAPPSIRS